MLLVRLSLTSFPPLSDADHQLVEVVASLSDNLLRGLVELIKLLSDNRPLPSQPVFQDWVTVLSGSLPTKIGRKSCEPESFYLIIVRPN